jgi:hypothetical protein
LDKKIKILNEKNIHGENCSNEKKLLSAREKCGGEMEGKGGRDINLAGWLWSQHFLKRNHCYMVPLGGLGGKRGGRGLGDTCKGMNTRSIPRI